MITQQTKQELVNNYHLNEQELQVVSEIIHNHIRTRADVMRSQVDRRRDINKECGYPESSSISAKEYYDMYDRNPYAQKVVKFLPKYTWQLQPSVYETNKDVETEFEKQWDALGSNLSTGTAYPSFFKREEGSIIYSYLKQLDEMAGIGHYAVMLLGLDDGLPLEMPAMPRKGQRLTFLQVFPEYLAEITSSEQDRTSPRYGMPNTYMLTFNDVQTVGASSAGSIITSTQQVHWTRLIHFADNRESSKVYGVPRTHSVFNCLMNIDKILGADGEGYWQGAFNILSLESHPQLGGDVKIDQQKMRNMLEAIRYGTSKEMVLNGLSAKAISPTVTDPKNHLDANVESICIQMDAPTRIFKGSERGELSSSQDAKEFVGTIKLRQRDVAIPHILVPFVDRCIWLQILPQPQEIYAEFPDIAAKTDAEKADVAVKRLTAVGTYITTGAEAFITFKDFLTQFLGMNDEEAQAIIENNEQRQSEENTGNSPLLSMVGGLTGMTELFKAASEKIVSEQQLKQLIMLFYRVDESQADRIIADGIPEPEPVPTQLQQFTNPQDDQNNETDQNNNDENNGRMIPQPKSKPKPQGLEDENVVKKV